MPVKKAVIPAAGYGTRSRPLSKAVPKELFPVDEEDRPVIHYVVKEALDADIEEIGIITREGKGIREYFEEDKRKEKMNNKGLDDLLEDMKELEEMGGHIKYIPQEEQKGLGHAVQQAEDFVGGDDFAILFGDSFFDVYRGENPLKDMIEVYDDYNGSTVIAAQRYEGDEVSSHGMMDVEQVEGDIYEVFDAIEKPDVGEEPSNIGTSCRYIISSKVFESLEEIGRGAENELQLTDAMVHNIKEKGERTYAYVLPYKRYHVSNRGDRFQAEKDLTGLRK
ncbi:MAG: UTP--glucose-1-phosphate uridylyltransferase [Candidatus Aenigmatarchaeota archaeon]